MVDFVRIRKLQEQEARLKWMVIKAEARATRSTTPITGMPRGGGSGNMQEDRMVELAAIREKHQEVFDELKMRRSELKKQVRYLRDPNENLAIQLRYLCGKGIEGEGGVCETMSYSKSQVLRFLRSGEARIRSRQTEKDGTA